MAASLGMAPPLRAFAGDQIFVKLSTDLIDTTRAYFEILITGGPAAAQELELSWTGGGITYTAGAAPTADGLTWPLKDSGDTVAQYANKVADFLREREDVTAIFDITRESGSGEAVLMTRKVAEVFAMAVESNTLAGIAVTANPVATNTTPAGLRALVDVIADTGDFNTDYSLLKLHATYNTTSLDVAIDISAAFVRLAPSLPEPDTINPNAPTFVIGFADSHMQRYYFRYADKYGTPPLAERLVRSPGSYFALLGARAGDAVSTLASGVLRHNYRRRDGGTFIKPVSTNQPDWVYWNPYGLDQEGVYISILIYWSDGTTSTYNPFGTAEFTWIEGLINWFPSGYRQMKLHLQSPSGATDPDALIVGYDWRLAPQNTLGGYQAMVKYEVDQLSTQGEIFLLFDNGVGGMETIRLHGAAQETYTGSREQWRHARDIGRTPQQGDLDTFGSEGAPEWKVSTGYYEETWYLEHLRQLMHADCWMVDLKNRRFLRVLIDNTSFEAIKTDDQNLHQFELTIKAAWTDQAWNV